MRVSGVEILGDYMKDTDLVFKSEEELYDRIKPALRSKKKMLLKKGAKRITEKDIWDFMNNNVWVNSNGLELCDMVDEILNAEDMLFIEYYHNKYLVNDLELPELVKSNKEQERE